MPVFELDDVNGGVVVVGVVGAVVVGVVADVVSSPTSVSAVVEFVESVRSKRVIQFVIYQCFFSVLWSSSLKKIVNIIVFKILLLKANISNSYYKYYCQY